MNEFWINFDRKEFACKCGCGFDTIDVELADVLADLRRFFVKPVFINSACRCESHNRKVGGAANSQHLFGKAADITIKDVSADKVYAYLCNKYPEKYGIGRYTGRTHIDVRQARSRWDKR
jgi:uncharacterized protein YcbK (DUF882 family)